MILLVLNLYLRIVSAASKSDKSKTKEINVFERYAGSLIYKPDDGRCIACDGTCDSEHFVLPHSWTAQLGATNDLASCKQYALSVAKFGVVGFTWWKSDHNCSLHVLGEKHNIAYEMINFNGYKWVEENHNNTGPLILARYLEKYNETAIDALCYYGLENNPSSNIVPEMTILMFIVVVGVMVAFYGWMSYTNNFPDYTILESNHMVENAGKIEPKPSRITSSVIKMSINKDD